MDIFLSPKRMIFSLPLAQALTTDFLLDPAAARRGLLQGIDFLLTRLAGNTVSFLYSSNHCQGFFISDDEAHVFVKGNFAPIF